jgi:hypothetical protein
MLFAPGFDFGASPDSAAREFAGRFRKVRSLDVARGARAAGTEHLSDLGNPREFFARHTREANHWIT